MQRCARWARALLGGTLLMGAMAACDPGGGAPELPADVGARPLDRQRYEALKAEADGGVTGGESLASEALGPSPDVVREFEGQRDNRFSPPDTTGALGPTRFVQMVNSKIGIYTREGTRLSSVTLNQFTGIPEDEAFQFDPQVLWDPDTSRFYYAFDDVRGPEFFATDNRLAFGFSKTASPNGPGDWCKYSSDFGYAPSEFPDYPKLGTTGDFILIGSNVFGGADFEYLGADVAYASKPPAGTGCPSLSSFTTGLKRNLRDPLVTGENRLFTPVPGTQVDPSGTGWIVSYPAAIYGELGPPPEEEDDEADAAASDLPPGQADILYTVRVTKGADGRAVFGTPRQVPVFRYAFPPSARQRGTDVRLDTLDARPTQAIVAVDPSQGGRTVLWTQHTVSGGAGSVVRWYALDPAAATVLQVGRVNHTTLSVFNGAISPDRVVNGTRREYGSNIVIGVSTSSRSTFPAIQMVSKRAGLPQSGLVLVKSSPGPNVDFTCSVPRPPCRWGDYSAATPDPAAPSGQPTGRVGLTNQWNVRGPTANFDPVWRTWIWLAVP